VTATISIEKLEKPDRLILVEVNTEVVECLHALILAESLRVIVISNSESSSNSEDSSSSTFSQLRTKLINNLSVTHSDLLGRNVGSVVLGLVTNNSDAAITNSVNVFGNRLAKSRLGSH